MYQSIYQMDPSAPPPPRVRPKERRVNIISEGRARERLGRVREPNEKELEWAVQKATELGLLDAAKTPAAVAEVEDRLTPVTDIIKATADKHGVSVAEIMGQRRDRHLIAARHEAMRIAYERRPDMSLSAIARVFRRDHTTFLHAVQKTDAWRRPGKPVELRQPPSRPATIGWLRRVLIWARGWLR